MDNMQTTILIIHTLIALGIIALVLIQRGKGSDAGAAFGAGASGTVFGAQGSTSFFSRTTAILATAFFATSLTLAYMSTQRSDSVESLLEDAPAVEVEMESRMPEVDSPEDTMPDLDDAETGLGDPVIEDVDVPALDTSETTEAPPPEE